MESVVFSQMFGDNKSGGLTIALPRVNSTIRVIFFIFVLVWIARTKAWETAFPKGIPAGVRTARVVCALAGLMGIAKCAVELYLTYLFFSGALTKAVKESQTWLYGIMQLLDQLWVLGFWLTLILIAFSVGNLFSNRLATKHALSQQ